MRANKRELDVEKISKLISEQRGVLSCLFDHANDSALIMTISYAQEPPN